MDLNQIVDKTELGPLYHNDNNNEQMFLVLRQVEIFRPVIASHCSRVNNRFVDGSITPPWLVHTWPE